MQGGSGWLVALLLLEVYFGGLAWRLERGPPTAAYWSDVHILRRLAAVGTGKQHFHRRTLALQAGVHPSSFLMG
ncbi:hypothetical protein NDU88_002162 [Pleurodeles waltl]|uniref:Secreted protein n=1 Tax=Pleurodeles waltl TaxID=8319 RepID=A0AAV7MMD3_PLEWA|nr:hypothetical protein NDU88_002162 [Pleurodeles waltl]